MDENYLMKNGGVDYNVISGKQDAFNQQYLGQFSKSMLNGATIIQSSFTTQSINSKVIIYIDKKNLKTFDSTSLIVFPDENIAAKQSDLITSKYSICEDMSLICDSFIYEKSKKTFHYNINDDYNIVSIYGTSINPKRIIHNISEVKCLEIKHKIQALNNALFTESIRF